MHYNLRDLLSLELFVAIQESFRNGENRKQKKQTKNGAGLFPCSVQKHVCHRSCPDSCLVAKLAFRHIVLQGSRSLL